MPLVSKTPDDGRKPLTFGIEIEFSLATLRDTAKDPEPEAGREVYGIDHRPATTIPAAIDDKRYVSLRVDWYAQWHVAETLRRAGIHAMNDDFELLNQERRRQRNDPNNPDKIWVEPWTVDNDVSITPPEAEEPIKERKKYRYYSIEIRSPPLYASENSILEVQKVCEALSNSYRLSCNPSTGIHVHVGRGPDGIEVDTLRNLMATIWVFEQHLDRVHPLHRLDRSNSNCWRLNDSASVNQIQDPTGEPHPVTNPKKRSKAESLQCILDAATRGEIVELMITGGRHTSSYRLAYSVLNLREPGGAPYKAYNDKLKRTLEYRQHESTLDYERVAQWIRLCIGLWEFARTVDPKDLELFLKQHINSTVADISLEQVLKQLDVRLTDVADYFGSNLAPRPQRKVRKIAGK